MDTEPRHYDDEPVRTHRHEFRYDIKDWWCHNCDNVTDFCKQQNDFGQDVPFLPT